MKRLFTVLRCCPNGGVKCPHHAPLERTLRIKGLRGLEKTHVARSGDDVLHVLGVELGMLHMKLTEGITERVDDQLLASFRLLVGVVGLSTGLRRLHFAQFSVDALLLAVKEDRLLIVGI